MQGARWHFVFSPIVGIDFPDAVVLLGHSHEAIIMENKVQERTISDVMEQLPYGLYIIGSRSPEGEPNAMMADWVMQVSFEPRLVAVAFEKDAHTLENIRTDRVFTVNMLSADSESMKLASRFAQPYFGSKVTGRGGIAMTETHHKLDGIDFTRAASGLPGLGSGAGLAGLSCRRVH